MQNQIAVLKEYDILERLGNQKRRKFCDVFKVQHKATLEVFILKVSINTLGKETLRSEAQFSFNSKGLPEVIWCIEDEDSTAILLKYKKGITLDHFFKKLKTKEQFDTLIRICENLSPILKELESKQIAHLDLKPSNILVDETDASINLIDFGLAIEYGKTNYRKLIFPLGYASPEVILNRLHLVNHQSDYFSIAVIIFQLFEGKLPLLNANPSITTNLQITHPLPESDKLDKKANCALQKLGAKFSFSVAPNALSNEEIDQSLKLGQSYRYNNFEEFITEFKSGRLKKKWIVF